ncbi:MAG: HAD-IA family hydrolase [Coriobacteriia bacterium]|nr:HAD-IA family hydrolase [Coriobacteriia bacterium]
MTPVNTIASSVSRLAALEAVLFDLDGTVVNTVPHILASFRHATEEVLGVSLSDEELLHNVGIPLSNQMYCFTDDDEVARRLLASYREFNQRTHDEMALLYPNTIVTLEALRSAGLPMAIVTSKSRMMAERAVALFDLGGYFEAVVTADDTPRHKPDPLPVVLGASLLGVEPSRAVYVGDSPADIESGRGAGVATVAATWGVASHERLAATGPDAIIDDIGALPPLLGIEF